MWHLISIQNKFFNDKQRMCVRPYAQYINEVFNINRLHIAQKVIAITNPVNGVDFLK